MGARAQSDRPDATRESAVREGSGAPYALGERVEVICRATQRRTFHRLDAVVGAGGMSTVYAATGNDGTRTALKIMTRALATDPHVRGRFFLEKALTDRVAHRARVPIDVAGQTPEGDPVLVMELIEGENVEIVRRRLGGKLPIPSALRVLDEVLDFLVACHAAEVLHRDIKTTNILLTTSRDVRVVDFGIAHCTPLDAGSDAAADMTFGTPSFMAPEQAAGLAVDADARSDVFSAGAVLFTLLTGKRLHRGRTHDESLLSAATQPAPRVLEVDDSVPDEIADIVDRALAFRREERFRDAGDMLDAIRRVRMRHEGRLTLTGLTPLAGAVMTGDDVTSDVPVVASGAISVARERVSRAPDARGTFEATPLPHLLTHILGRALDGTLIVSSDDAREVVEFSAGAPLRRSASAAADPLVGSLARIARLPDSSSYRFYVEDRVESGWTRIEPLDAILTSTRRLRDRPSFVARMRETLERLGGRRLRLHPAATPERFGLSPLEKRVLDTARELELAYAELLDAEVAPRDVIDPLLYALGITRHLDVGVPNAWPTGVRRV